MTLTALENPQLLPSSTPAEQTIQDMSIRMNRLHQRLQAESDSLKAAAAAAANKSAPRVDTATGQPIPSVRRVQPGDKVWLTYSDSERARYLRKHGHGTPWRHAYKVLETKPHAVRLEIPKDGSAPDVLPWQSLRKCAFAAPNFHSDDLPVPTVDNRGIPLIPTDSEATEHIPTPAPAAPPVDFGTTWDASEKFEVERIVSAHRVGGGWKVSVKWAGYSDLTEEPLSRVKHDVRHHPDLLRQIDQCKEDYLDRFPKEREAMERTQEPPPAPEPTRVQPKRERARTKPFMFSLMNVQDPTDHMDRVAAIYSLLTEAYNRDSQALKFLLASDALPAPHISTVIHDNPV